MAIGILGFVLAGIGLLFWGSSPAEMVMGAVCILFFGVLGFKALYSTLVKGGGNLIVSGDGITLNYPDVPPMFVHWQDIEGFGVRQNKADWFTTIQMSNYDGLIESVAPLAAKSYMNKVKFVKRMGNTCIGLKPIQR